MKTEVVAQEAARRSRAPLVSRRGLLGAFTSAIACIWKYLFGVLLVQNFLPSFLVAGWSARVAQRTVYQAWWRRSELAQMDGTFQDFARAHSQTREMAHWPNWIVSSVFRSELQGITVSFNGIKSLIAAFLRALGQNFKTGVQMVFTTWTLTLPGCAVMLFSWYAGWINSFNKGYEQAVIGPATGLLGIGLFIAAMCYVPLAQMRQAATGKWRAFYDYRMVRALIRERFIACFLLACAYSLFLVPVTILKAYPYFMSSAKPAWETLTNAQALDILKAYFLWGGLLMFPLYVALRILAARIYASAALSALRRGTIHEDMLSENEWETLNRLDLLTLSLARTQPTWLRATTWVASRAMRVTCGILVFFVWFTFVAQIYTSEFLHKTARGQGWLNQPLVQLPWFSYIPPRLHTTDE